jgi:hypothetical protein
MRSSPFWIDAAARPAGAAAVTGGAVRSYCAGLPLGWAGLVSGVPRSGAFISFCPREKRLHFLEREPAVLVGVERLKYALMRSLEFIQ